MIVVNVKSPDSLNAGTKAPQDINNVLKEKFDAKIVDLILGENIVGKLKYKMKFFITMLKARMKKEVLVLQFPIIERNFILNLANKEKNVNFLVEIFTDNDISDPDFRNISNIIKDKYKNIKLRLIIYVFNKNEYYKELIDEIKEFPDTEDLEIDEENLNNKLELKIIENNLII